MRQEAHIDSLEAILEERLSQYRILAGIKSLATAEFCEKPGRILAASGIEYPTCNAVFELQPSPHILEKDIDETIAFFQEKSLPFLWWSEAKNLSSKGLQYGGAMIGAVLDFSEDLPFACPSLDVVIKQVETEDEIEQFWRVCNICFPMGSTANMQMADVIEGAWASGQYIFFLALVEGIPAGIIALSLGETICSLWYCGTSPEYRKRGIGSALTLAALQEGKKRGISFCSGARKARRKSVAFFSVFRV